MSGHQGFIVLMVLLPLYEKYLRVKHNMEIEEKFSKHHRIFNVIGRHLQVSADDAYLFWTNVRNGLLHSALPKHSNDFNYGIREDGPPLQRDANLFWINPFEMRDRILEEIKS